MLNIYNILLEFNRIYHLLYLPLTEISFAEKMQYLSVAYVIRDEDYREWNNTKYLTTGDNYFI